MCMTKVGKFTTVRLIAVRRLHTDEDMLVQQVLGVGDDGGELEKMDKTMKENCKAEKNHCPHEERS